MTSRPQPAERLTVVSLYSPLDSSYLDPADAAPSATAPSRCAATAGSACELCPSFRSLFEMIDANDDGAHDVKVLTDASTSESSTSATSASSATWCARTRRSAGRNG